MRSQKVKVLVLTSSFPRYKTDWWQQAVLSIYSNMDLKKYDITVIAPSAPGAKRSEKIKGINVKRFTYFYPPSLQLLTSGEGILYTSRKKKFLGKIQIITFLLAEFFSVLKTLARSDYDIIHANWILPQGLIAVIAKFIFKKPVVVTVHGTDIFALKNFNFLKAFILKHNDLCTANSSATYEEVLKVYPKTRAEIVHMGVDIRMFNPNKKDINWKREFGNNSKIILGVGRLIKWKGFEYLVKSLPYVLAKFSRAKLIIVGSGPEEENLKGLARRLNLEIDKNIFFLGHIGPDRLSCIYASSDIVVLPSITVARTGEKEGQGNIVLEAMASGTPVVASRSGGIVDMIDGKSTGLLFEEKDFRQLAKNIISVFSNGELRKSLSKNGLKLVREKYPWKNTSSIFEELYESLTS